uniref:Cysteine proteinase 1, mitochondrial n=1 Tax=Colletotrichum fructicola (strain Nara gc5) TaxID=1213859 RepID=L2G3T5_COLFN
MGSQPSKTAAVDPSSEKELLERLRRFQVTENELVNVENGGGDEKNGMKLLREPEGLPVHLTQSWQSRFLSDPKNKLALTALSTADPRTVLTSTSTKLSDPQIFNVKIPFEGGPITNQRSSGRCWLFASTNTFRVALMKRYNLEAFELSQSYLFFWDKLEKSNYFLEQIIDTAAEDLDGRLIQALLGDIVSDGGQWDMVYNLVQKYGLVPQALYPDSWNAMNSGVLNSIVKTKLREYALILRKEIRSGSATAQTLSSTKEKMVREILSILTLTLGPPPNPREEFTWTYLDKNGKAHELTTTPAAFAKDVYSSDFRITSAVIEGMVSLVHDPRHEPLTLMTVDRLGKA